MAFFEPFLHYGTATILVLMAILGYRDGRQFLQVRLAVLTCLSSACVVVTSGHNLIDIPHWLFAVARIGDTLTLALIWLMGRSMFEDEFRIGRWEAIIVTAYLAPMLALRADDYGITLARIIYLDILANALAIGMMTHLAYVTLKGRQDDLVEARRRFRVPFALSLSAIGIIIIATEEILPRSAYYFINLSRTGLVALMTLWAFFQLMRFQPGYLAFKKTEPVGHAATIEKPSVKDAALSEALTVAMTTDRLYQRQGLTITSLADHIGFPEHQLRRFINDQLGARNFSHYLNDLRLKEAAERLITHEEIRTPVLTIAMDAGFNSLAPFNRAFKDAYGMTPTEYRKAKS